MKNIVIIEDDQDFSNALEMFLRLNQFNVFTFYESVEGYEYILKHLSRIDCIILDINMANMNGLEVCEKLRSLNILIPIIILTADLRQDNLYKSFSVGSDDFLQKPINSSELLARINARLRYKGSLTSQISHQSKLIYDHNVEQFYFNDQRLNLSKKEFMVLKELYDNANIYIPKEHLNFLIDVAENSRSIDKHIGSLKKILQPNEEDQQLIQTRYGQGICLHL